MKKAFQRYKNNKNNETLIMLGVVLIKKCERREDKQNQKRISDTKIEINAARVAGSSKRHKIERHVFVRYHKQYQTNLPSFFPYIEHINSILRTDINVLVSNHF